MELKAVHLARLPSLRRFMHDLLSARIIFDAARHWVAVCSSELELRWSAEFQHGPGWERSSGRESM
jgi:hypothetical protein